MRGRWHVRPVGAQRVGSPWLVLRGAEHEAVLWNGPVLELGRGAVERLGPDIMDSPPRLDQMVARIRRVDPARAIAEVLVDQRLVAGIGNLWRAEALHEARLSPWTPVGELGDGELRRLLDIASEAMRGGRRARAVYGRAGRPCRRCGTPIAAAPVGEDARTAYWCPSCQAGRAPGSA
jgi:endonuclease-8